MSFFIATAHASGTATPQAQSPMMSIFMMVAMIAIFYFLIWRPQSKRAKEHRELINSLTVGSEVMFAGGLMGRITKLQDDIAVIELSKGVEIKIQRTSVISVLPEGTLNNL